LPRPTAFHRNRAERAKQGLATTQTAQRTDRGQQLVRHKRLGHRQRFLQNILIARENAQHQDVGVARLDILDYFDLAARFAEFKKSKKCLSKADRKLRRIGRLLVTIADEPYKSAGCRD